MYALKKNCIYDVDINKVKRTEDVTVIDYGVRYFGFYKDTLSVINEIYLMLVRIGINDELFEEIKGIVEKLNNLSHFECDLDSFNNEDDIVDFYLGLYDTFKYKKLSEFDKSNSIQVYKAKFISNEEISRLKESLRFSSKDKDFKLNYKDGYYIGATDKEGVFPLVSYKEDTRVISITSGSSDKVILKELLNIFTVLYKVDAENTLLDSYCCFELCKNGIHKEIITIINRLLSSLCYLFNSTSFRENNYYAFDRFELQSRVRFNLEDSISYTRKVLLSQIKYSR